MSTYETALPPVTARDQARALFGQTMGLVAVTAGLFALDVLKVFLLLLSLFSRR